MVDVVDHMKASLSENMHIINNLQQELHTLSKRHHVKTGSFERDVGKEIVLFKDMLDRNALCNAFMNNAPKDIVLKLIEVGGRDIILEKAWCGQNPLHYAYEEPCVNEVSSDVLDLLVQKGGKEILMQKQNDGKTPLQELITGLITWMVVDEMSLK